MLAIQELAFLSYNSTLATDFKTINEQWISAMFVDVINLILAHCEAI